jgi:hypothetical protein
MRKNVPTNLSFWEKLRKLDAAKINTFTVKQNPAKLFYIEIDRYRQV